MSISGKGVRITNGRGRPVTYKGTHTDTQYIPEPSVQTFEKALAQYIGKRPCDGCGKPLGNEPRKQHNKRQYHPQCWERIQSFDWVGLWNP